MDLCRSMYGSSEEIKSTLSSETRELKDDIMFNKGLRHQ